MAFGKNAATAAQRAQARLAEQGRDPDALPESQGDGASAIPSSSPAPATPPSGGRPAAFGRPQAPRHAPTAPAAPAPAPPAAANDSVASTPSVPARPTAEATPFADLFAGYVRQVVERTRRSDGLPLRLERLIDEISDFLGYDRDQRESAKSRALAEPAAWEQKLAAYYRSTVRPHRAQTARSLEEARAKHPGKIVFICVQGNTHTLKVLDPATERGRQQAALDGATVEAVASSRTPFCAPREIFGHAPAQQIIEAEALDGAFGEEPGASRAPRP